MTILPIRNRISPDTLQEGDEILIIGLFGEPLTAKFIRREPAFGLRKAINILQHPSLTCWNNGNFQMTDHELYNYGNKIDHNQPRQLSLFNEAKTETSKWQQKPTSKQAA